MVRDCGPASLPAASSSSYASTPRREWCSASCGNRARVARHYDRHH
nr:CGNR zinc finger domain-containing protein [Fodinicola feengrottensis]